MRLDKQKAQKSALTKDDFAENEVMSPSETWIQTLGFDLLAIRSKKVSTRERAYLPQRKRYEQLKKQRIMVRVIYR